MSFCRGLEACPHGGAPVRQRRSRLRRVLHSGAGNGKGCTIGFATGHVHVYWRPRQLHAALHLVRFTRQARLKACFRDRHQPPVECGAASSEGTQHCDT